MIHPLICLTGKFFSLSIFSVLVFPKSFTDNFWLQMDGFKVWSPLSYFIKGVMPKGQLNSNAALPHKQFQNTMLFIISMSPRDGLLACSHCPKTSRQYWTKHPQRRLWKRWKTRKEICQRRASRLSVLDSQGILAFLWNIISLNTFCCKRYLIFRVFLPERSSHNPDKSNKFLTICCEIFSRIYCFSGRAPQAWKLPLQSSCLGGI